MFFIYCQNFIKTIKGKSNNYAKCGNHKNPAPEIHKYSFINLFYENENGRLTTARLLVKKTLTANIQLKEERLTPLIQIIRKM